MEIIPFTTDRYDNVYALWQQCSGVGLSNADSLESIAMYLDRNPGMSFIAAIDDSVVGTILAGHDGRRGYIHHLAVHPAHRRKGIARKLVEHSLIRLKEATIQKCHIFIFNDNEDGIAFWKSEGWSQRGDIGVISKDL